MSSNDGSSHKLEQLYQQELQKLLNLNSRQPALCEDDQHTQLSSASPSQNELMNRRILLKELNHQIKWEKQKHELLQMQKNLSSIPLSEPPSSCPMQNWYHEMYLYDKTWHGCYSDTRYFFDLKCKAGCLSFSSRYQGRCLRIAIKTNNNPEQKNEFLIESSLAIEGLNMGIEYLTKGKPAKRFVEDVIHPGLKLL